MSDRLDFALLSPAAQNDVLFQNAETLLAGQRQLIALLTSLPQEIRTMLDAELTAILSAMDAATTAVATRIDALAAKVATDMSPEDVASLKAALSAETTKLQALGADPANPVPAAPAEPGETIVP